MQWGYLNDVLGFAIKKLLAASARPSANDRRLHDIQIKAVKKAIQVEEDKPTNNPRYHPHTPRTGGPLSPCCHTSLHSPECGACISSLSKYPRPTKPFSNL